MTLQIDCIGDPVRTGPAEASLRQLLAKYDLQRFLLTRHVRIEPDVIPHSHPVLTLDTEFAHEPDRYLAGFLHEQMHWHVTENEAGMYRAVADFIDHYPEVPVGGAESAHNRFSVYLHFIVNWLELLALESCLGASRAREILATHQYYRWIYATLLRDEHVIAAINRRQGFDLPK